MNKEWKPDVGEKYYYISIPQCCALMEMHVKWAEFKGCENELFGVLVFNSSKISIYLERIHKIQSLLLDRFKTKEVDPQYRGYWIHVPTACRLKEIKVSEKKSDNLYACNYFDTEEEARNILSMIKSILFE